MKAASLLLLCAVSFAVTPCFAQNTAVAPQAEQQSPGYATAPQIAASQNTAAYAYAATLSLGLEPSNMSVSTEPSTLHVGIEPSTLHVGIEPSTLHVGIEPSTLHVGIEPATLHIGIEPSTLDIGTERSSLHMGIEPSFPAYLALMPPFAATAELTLAASAWDGFVLLSSRGRLQIPSYY
jgi:hypothetical protein